MERMSRGGKRPGAGRPKGSVSKLATEAVAKAKATGDLPHEFLLKIVRGEPIDGTSPPIEQRIHAAIAVAPYFAPKLATVEQKIDTSVRAVVSSKPLTVEEWATKYGIDRTEAPTRRQ